MKAQKVKLNYPEDAYTFVREAVNFSVSRLSEPRHVSALELLEGCKLYVQEQYGLLAQSVLESWRIKSADDIGNIVFELINAGLLSADPNDSREDFSVKFDLFDRDVFRVKYMRDKSEPLITD